jgi:hypothetical protein
MENVRSRFDRMARSRPAGDTDYEQLVGGYATIRQPDARIEAMVHAGLGDARTVLNVGAGAGSYEPLDRHVVAVEPSAAMRAQRPRHLAPAIDATAETLPFDDDAFDAAMAMITVHQWPDPWAGLANLRRVARGPVVVLSFDGWALEGFWLHDYCPEVLEVDRGRYPDLDRMAEAIGPRTEVEVVPVPLDCADGFAEAFYGRPERLLDPSVRAAQSGWARLEPGMEEQMVEQLTADLASGAWDERYGHLRTQPTFESSLRLLVGHPE